MNEQPVFRMEGVKKIYGERLVLNIQALDVNPGEVLAIVGPSGAGKSTLLRMLNFLEYPDEGILVYGGMKSSPELPIKTRREVTTVFQRPALLNLSVEANIAYGLILRGVREREDVERVIVLMGLGKVRRAAARTLSGGEMQRVALARAMVVRPRVLLLDEPTANLDPYNIGLIEEVVREINRSGTTVVLVTHNIFQARRLAHRAALLLDGIVIETAENHTFFDQPRDSRTSAFVKGEMIY